MKKLIALSIVFLAGCSSDIVVEDDVGQKIVIKESAVEVTVMGPPELRQRAIEWTKQKRGAFNASKDLRDCKLELPAASCNKIYGSSVKSQQMELNKLKALLARAAREGVYFNKVRYRPISVDLNGNKIPGIYDEIFCTPSKFDSSQKDLISKLADSLALETPVTGSNYVAEITRLKVCTKYGSS